MILLAAVLGVASGSGELVLREKTRVQGRYVRLADLLDPSRGSEAARNLLADVWLGRAPEEGATRRIEVDEIRRELERRGFDPGAFTFVGRDVQVERGAGTETDGLRRALAFEIKRLVLEKDGRRADEIAVRIVQIRPEPPAGAELAEVREDGTGYVARFAGGAEARVIAGVLRLQECAFAAKDVPAGKILEREDVDLRRVETDGGEARPGALEAVLGAAAAVRIRKGNAIAAADLNLKPVVRRGDIVRLVSAAFEVDARALEDGAPGREIEVEVAATHARLRGRVAGPGKVELR